MYNMLTGIRIGVSRCQAKIRRPLTDLDYTAKHKFTFDIVGNELTPSAKYDFKFKDYAPWVFRELREYFHLDPADYLLSLTAKYILSELGSPGKSGSFFYFSRDYRFIIKTIRHGEHKFLRSILKDYHEHVKANPHTLLSRFYGLHRVKLPRGKKIHFVIMNNLFPPHRDIHETYDLKGSAVGREYPEEKAAQKKGAVLKDLNWIKRGRELELGPEKRAMFEAQIRSDVELLQKLNIMDYSLLIGLHDMKRGNKENLRQDALQVVQPETNAGALKREPTTGKRGTEKDAFALRAAVRRSDPKALGSTATARLPERETSDRHHFVFYQDEGGFRSTNENNEATDWVYYFGIIDTLTLYNGVKRGEHYWKSLTNNSTMISAIHPVPYGKRFCNFLFSVIRGADKSQRPRME
ncbi:SAICAR synthase-like protein [Acaromyces ingoldii]|uniref:1-phosphatidylinositol-4-phosphate 5-kinase n=1 Tax=Acaromyces ingoldii TaxID=215250 RepID=A0A316YUX0_9BASI|nr:SAICAR synthase-like protein [Acaromyces ingoldii]PWN93041.1 SAICAR synthase-like protein [Acaromyces ingoldii]